jgi:predicted helicase
VRANPKLSGTKHNVFGIQTGVAISFMVKRAKAKGCRIFYARRPEFEIADEKLAFLDQAKLRDIVFDEIPPDAKHNWINLAQNDFESLLPTANKVTKAAVKPAQQNAIFKLFSLGVVTNRDDWVYGDNPGDVEAKVRALIKTYNADLKRLSGMRTSEKLPDMLDPSIKWTRAVKNDLRKGVQYDFKKASVVPSFYRPFVKRWLYFSRQLNEMVYQIPQLFGPDAGSNLAFSFAAEERSEFGVIAFADIPNKDIFMPSAAQVLALYRYENGKRVDNITDWALDQFRKQFPSGSGKKNQTITKESIFHYVYGVLHDPIYREKYALNLKREFPRIPFYKDFWQWAEWAKELMNLHIGYESVAPTKLKRVDLPDEKARKAGLPPKCILKADKDGGRIIIDSETTLTGIPSEAWDYRLGNRSALEWILDQYKEKKPKDPTIREKFNTYRFADYKGKLIDLLMCVTTVSVRTVAIVSSMKNVAR